MYIEELVLEGFKSYPVRTQITGWDPSFNCITGLNGSGKSNILDAICFVLGLTNMSQVRAQNQQDLIYKRGQAGVTRASVTVVFNNSDKSKSPIGFEQLAQVTVTRQIALPNISKYILNGHKSTQQQVQLLFQGVQLNINNPNFLIMQGRITKVLNMRPPEILGLIEEAAGTRMYEERKDKAKKTMDKKEKRVQEFTTLLEEEITPKLDTLREEKRSFLEYQKRTTELEKLARLLRAYEWREASERVKRKEADVEKKKGDLADMYERQDENKEQLQLADAERKDAIKRREKELSKGGHYQKLEKAFTDLDNKVTQLQARYEIMEGGVVSEEAKIQSLESDLEKLKANLGEKETEVQQMTLSHSQAKHDHDLAQQKYENAHDLHQTLMTGLTSSVDPNKSGGGYLGQIADEKARMVAASTEEQQSKNKLAMLGKELTAAQARYQKVEREANDGTKQVEKGRKEIQELEAKLKKTGWSEQKEQSSADVLRAARERVRQLTQERDQYRQQVSGLDFTYSDPAPNFDRRQVKGLIANLITIDESDYDKSTALEIAAGGRLYNVVVDNERVGSQLLSKGQLRKRVTLIPLNKISAFKASAQKLNAATSVSKGKAKLALTLIGHDREVSAAMTFVFGDTLICDDAESAKAVTFHPQVSLRSVTTQGDVYDPSGTISGGSAPSSSGLLVKVQALKRAEAALQEAKDELRRLEHEEQSGKAARDAWTKAKRDLEMKQHEVKLLEEQVTGSNAAMIAAEVTQHKNSMEELKLTITAAQKKFADAKAECAKLEKDMKEFEGDKSGKMSQLKSDVQKHKKALAQVASVLKVKQHERQTAQLELDQLKEDIEKSAKEIEQAHKGLTVQKKELAKMERELEQAKIDHADADAALQRERAALSQFDEEVKALEATIKRIQEALTDFDVEIKKTEHDIATSTKDRQTSQALVAQLEKQNPWIPDEKQQFGKAGGMFDFSQHDIPKVREKAKELEDLQKGMKKKINPKVLNMIDNVEKREAELKRNLQTVLKDKTKIEETIEELDRYKFDTLEKTWSKVSKDFGEIFGDLLPGNSAKLQYAERGNIAAGLEVKVQLGTVWKQSLTELSGGQRSLIALSLIMSLLQFKPAPMYILDEIDAALDLSHTQHIGELFKNRFKNSQFIVVSLKDGLFNNANVLFRTKFRDGTSIVEQTTQRSTSAASRGGRGTK